MLDTLNSTVCTKVFQTLSIPKTLSIVSASRWFSNIFSDIEELNGGEFRIKKVNVEKFERLRIIRAKYIEQIPPKIRVLICKNGEFTTIPQLPSTLEILDLNSNKEIQDLSPLAGLTSLQIIR